LKIYQLLRQLPARKREDGIWLLSARLSLTRSELMLDLGRDLSEPFLKRWKKDWARRLKGEPLQYIAGSAPFYGREFLVDRSTLIPRPETESLVELALGLIPKGKPARVLDIGTGTGAIALTLKLERPEIEAHATDISGKALTVAKKNGEKLGAVVSFHKGDLFFPALRRQSWDVVVSNPPYLDFARDRVTKEVREWEPDSALEPAASQRVEGMKDRGLWCGERILRACAESKVAFTAMELSARGARSLEARWRKNARVERIWREADLAGRKRFLLVAWKNA
jgi:release factor-specific protein-(glutamine-N5) methyltransferase